MLHIAEAGAVTDFASSSSPYVPPGPPAFHAYVLVAPKSCTVPSTPPGAWTWKRNCAGPSHVADPLRFTGVPVGLCTPFSTSAGETQLPPAVRKPSFVIIPWLKSRVNGSS